MVNQYDYSPAKTRVKFAKGPEIRTVENGQPYVDRKAMSARAIISTSSVDRVGDILLPTGCDLKFYAKNPVVLWGHGLEGIVLPIGTSRSPDGKLAIEIGEDIYATCWFSQKSLEASQIFELVDEGIVRATSVRETPVKFKTQYKDGRAVQVVSEWQLEEWSWCAIGVNPDAVGKTLNRNRLGGKPIVQSIWKSLSAVMPPRKVTGIGLTRETQMKENDDEDEDRDDSETPADEGDESATQAPFGSGMISGYHKALCEANKKAESGMGAMEHPGATAAMRAALDCVKDVMTGLKGSHSEHYPNFATKDEDGEGDEESSSEMKAWLAKGVHENTLKGFAVSLKSIRSQRNLTPSQRVLLMEMETTVTRWASKAKSLSAAAHAAKSTPTPVVDTQAIEQAKLDELFAKLKK